VLQLEAFSPAEVSPHQEHQIPTLHPQRQGQGIQQTFPSHLAIHRVCKAVAICSAVLPPACCSFPSTPPVLKPISPEDTSEARTATAGICHCGLRQLGRPQSGTHPRQGVAVRPSHRGRVRLFPSNTPHLGRSLLLDISVGFHLSAREQFAMYAFSDTEYSGQLTGQHRKFITTKERQIKQEDGELGEGDDAKITQSGG